MIDEKKLIEEIREKIIPEKFGERCNALDVIYAVLQVIEEQPKVGEWIPADSPPTSDDKVLVSYQKRDGQKMLVGFDRYKRYPEHRFERWEGKGRRVKTWQPLPEPFGFIVDDVVEDVCEPCEW